MSSDGSGCQGIESIEKIYKQDEIQGSFAELSVISLYFCIGHRKMLN